MSTFLARRYQRDEGFTLIELLVVMIIIGILAAVAIPIFLNQQKTARDTATVSDVKNVATQVNSLLVRYPDATFFYIMDATAPPASSVVLVSGTDAAAQWASDVNGDGKLLVIVGDSQADSSSALVSVSKGTHIGIGTGMTGATIDPGTFAIRGLNPAGKVYTSSASVSTRIQYESDSGGFKK